MTVINLFVELWKYRKSVSIEPILIFTIGIATGATFFKYWRSKDVVRGLSSTHELVTDADNPVSAYVNSTISDGKNDQAVSPFSGSRNVNDDALSVKKDNCVSSSEWKDKSDSLHLDSYSTQEINEMDESIQEEKVAYANSSTERDEMIILQDSILAKEEMMEVSEMPLEDILLTSDEQRKIEGENIREVNSQLESEDDYLFEEILENEALINSIHGVEAIEYNDD